MALTQATMSWFPFLFYSTTYIVDAARRHRDGRDASEKIGSFGMLLFALLSMLAGAFLPVVTIAGHAAPHAEGDAAAALRPAWRQATLRSMWTFGCLSQALILFATFFVRTQQQALGLVMLMGVPWSIWTWVPFALLGEFVREAEAEPAQDAVEDQWSAQQIMDRHEPRQRTSVHDLENPSRRTSAHEGAAPQRIVSGSHVSSVVSRGREVPADGTAPLEDSIRGGTILGIHNLAIVLPQFLVALIASLIFRVTSHAPSKHRPGDDGDVAWVLRFGAVMALVAAALTRRIPLTQSERAARNIAGVRLPLDDDEEPEAPHDTL